MSKEYVVDGAEIICEYGQRSCLLKVPEHRHFKEKERNVANETDIGTDCIKGFGVCRSGARMQSVGADVIHSQQVDTILEGGQACVPEIIIPWQDVKEDVKAGNYKTVLQDGWTICSRGFGIIKLISSGQMGGNVIQQILEKLKELEKEVNQYMKDNQISKKYRGDLLDCVLLWNGYSPESMCWDYRGLDMQKKFCEYLSIKNPSLYGFFERSLTIKASDGEDVDLGYLIGAYKAYNKNGETLYWSFLDNDEMVITQEMISNDAMFNAYIEATLQAKGKQSSRLIIDYINGEFSGHQTENRYKRYINANSKGGYRRAKKEIERGSSTQTKKEKTIVSFKDVNKGQEEYEARVNAFLNVLEGKNQKYE